MGMLCSCYGQLDSVCLLHWRDWEKKGANVRGGGGEGGRIACAEIGNHISISSSGGGGGSASSWSWSCSCPQLPILCASLIEISLPAEVPRSLRQPSPPTTHFSLGARLFLAQLGETVLPVLLLFIPVSLIFNGKWRSAHSRTVFSASSQSKLYLSFVSPRRQTGPTSFPSTTRKYSAPFGG